MLNEKEICFFSGKDLTVCASDGEVINKVIITERDYLKE